MASLHEDNLDDQMGKDDDNQNKVLQMLLHHKKHKPLPIPSPLQVLVLPRQQQQAFYNL